MSDNLLTQFLDIPDRGIFPRMPFHQLDISEGKSDISYWKGATYGPRTIQPTVFFRKLLSNHLHPINLCWNVSFASAGGRLFAGCSPTCIPERGFGVVSLLYCFVWRGELSYEEQTYQLGQETACSLIVGKHIAIRLLIISGLSNGAISMHRPFRLYMRSTKSEAVGLCSIRMT